jgi:myo-inositol-1-phosphate synthase
MKVGVIIVGVRGATASTMIATACAPRSGDEARYLLSSSSAARQLDLVPLADIAWAGFDTMRESWPETLTRHGVLSPQPHAARLESKVQMLDAVSFESDHATAVEGVRPPSASGRVVLEQLRAQIRAFKERAQVERLILLHLGAPSVLPASDRWPDTGAELMAALGRGELQTAPVYYTVAAILEGAAVIDYTASATLEIPGILDLACIERVPLAGRDGSTGQTLMKSVLAQAFSTRRLKIRGWYSTNILGNHDGLVLSDERYADVKKIDKTALLEQILGESVESHLVDIRHYAPAGDRKEAWDAVDFETWYGGSGELRINWRAGDSLLATPPILDLIRFTEYALRLGSIGMQTQLSGFFKHPLGTSERRYLKLAEDLERYIGREIEKASR